jgi:cytidylate kinase
MAGKSNATLAAVAADINRRDQNDSTRKLAPLKPAEDAIRIDSTDLSIREVVDLMISHVRKQ